MLSIGKLATGQADYYLQQAQGRVDRTTSVASGVEDYYTGGPEAAAEWLGRGAASLGLSGRVGDRELRAVLDGRHPTNGYELRSHGTRVPGFDLTFSAPKSVSVLFGVAGRPIRKQIQAAHEIAVRDALGYLEDVAAYGRRGSGGFELTQASGLVAAAFRHRTSRAGDPQLHTHVLIANLVRGEDGRWTAMDGRRVYAHAKTAGYLYEARLRAELTLSLGVRWTPVRNGIALSADRGVSVSDDDLCRIAETLGGAEGLTKRWSTFSRRDVIRAWCEALPAGTAVTSESIARLADAFLASEASVALLCPDSSAQPGATIQRRDGRSIPALRDELRYSTPELLAVERRIIDAAVHGANAGAGMAERAATAAAIARRPYLSAEQREMVRRLARDGSRVAAVVGKAGTGKTTALSAAREAWEASGYTVLGVAVAPCCAGARGECWDPQHQSRGASARGAAGRPVRGPAAADAVRVYEAHDRLVVGGDRAAVMDKLVEDWWKVAQPTNAVMGVLPAEALGRATDLAYEPTRGRVLQLAQTFRARWRLDLASI